MISKESKSIDEGESMKEQIVKDEVISHVL